MTRIPLLEEPQRWTARRGGTTVEDHLGVALRAAGEASLARAATFDPQAAPAAVTPRAPMSRRWLLPALAATALLLVGAVAAAQAIRAARLAAFTRVEVPGGSTVSLANRRHRKLNLVGPIAVSGDADRLAISGEGQAQIEVGEQPLEVLPPGGGPIIQLAPGTSWPPVARRAEPARPQPAAVASGAARPSPSPAASRSPSPRPASAAGERARGAPARRLAMLEPPAFVRPAIARSSDEAAQVASIFRALRAEHDPARALALAEGCAQAFPDGELTVEVTAARVEALLALGRRPQALEILDSVPDGAAPTSPARTLLRGELRLAAGRCAQALQDFVAVQSTPPAAASNDLQSRALVGHATCSARLGDLAGARASFSRYLAVSPAGPAAAEARGFLSAHPVGASGGTFGPPATLGQSEKGPQ